MSIWGPLPAENDDAADWLTEFLDEPDLVKLNEAFDAVLDLDRGDYLEVTEGAVAVAAASLVAEALGAPGPDPILLPEQLAPLQNLMSKLAAGARASLIKRSLRALRKVTEDADNSELFQLMHESPDLGLRWRNAVDSLKARLLRLQDSGPPSAGQTGSSAKRP